MIHEDCNCTICRWRVLAENAIGNARYDRFTHLVEEGRGQTTCCQKPPFEISRTDCLTTNPSLVTCPVVPGEVLEVRDEPNDRATV